MEALADFHTGSYCIEAYTASAQQQEEPKPDLWWSDPNWEPNPPEKNKDITFWITVHKSGKINQNFNVQLYLEGGPKRIKTLTPYDFVNDKTRVKFPPFQWPSDRNDHIVKIVIDSHNDIDESNEGNNVWTKSLHAATNNNNINELPDLYTIAFQMHAISQTTQQPEINEVTVSEATAATNNNALSNNNKNT